ncbi:hypothetical protein GJ744_011975 [Endocarpon pusillum]|uniref:Uncharacterized protein n=1 Tax=Endocarpon pusillum TaxID=364733 RepID=A0A8H7ATW4_9EURO|nr:hypothetical protein GJ744_011975 [Endocarpon pusillum]
MGVPAPGALPTPGLSTFSDDILKIELSGPDRQHLTFIDVPGTFGTPTEDVTTKEDVRLVPNMVRSYIKDPSNRHFSSCSGHPWISPTHQILGMAEDLIHWAQRTMGVLTKPDLVDKGTGGDVI